MPKKKRMVTWLFPERIEVKVHKEGEFYIYDYKEFVPQLPEDRYGKDDTQKLQESGLVRTPDCEVLKFKSDKGMCHAVLKTKNPIRLLVHLANEIDCLGRNPVTEEDTLPQVG